MDFIEFAKISCWPKEIIITVNISFKKTIENDNIPKGIDEPIITDREKLKIKFFEFLKSKNCLDKYLENFQFVKKESFEEFQKKWGPGVFISSAFSWHHTSQGHDFWDNIDAGWQELLKEADLL